MSDLRQTLSHSLFTVAGALALSACIEEPNTSPQFGAEDDGISIEDEAGEQLPDLPDIPDESDDSENQDPATCEATTAIASNVPPNVVLVLDKSRSMILYTWDDDGDPKTDEVTRWASLHATVDTITHQYQDGMRLGLSLFPSADATSAYAMACHVNELPEVGVGLGNAAAIMAAIPAGDDLDLYGATPASAGMTAALTHLESLNDGRPAAVILVTDGAANCSLAYEGTDRFNLYDEDLPLIVADAWDRAGIPTYVIGIDIEETSDHPFTKPREKLDQVAQLGGVPRAGELGFYDAANAEALMSALDTIASSVSCGVTLGKPASSINELVVRLGGELLPRLDSCEQGDGWIFSDPEGTLDRIELCNGSCDALLEFGEVEAEFLCPPQP